jgi:outer membrane protein assembly factor BamE (lipoprotein component of BamABCDE complex)
MWQRPVQALLIAIATLSATGCMSASQHRADVDQASGANLTVGTVQREIRIGMSGAEVAAVLGSPNIVSTDEERREVWIYDKVSTDVTYSKSSGYGTILLIGGSREAGAASSTQKTLTVIVKFDNDKKVRDFAYHTSKF